MTRTPFTSDKTPPPAGAYSVAMEAGGLVFLSGQTPRDRDNVRHGDKPFAFQARMTLDNLEAAANAAGLSLKDAVRVGVFHRNPADAKEFDATRVIGCVSRAAECAIGFAGREAVIDKPDDVGTPGIDE